jgi:uncharacterized protein (TIGR02145 family)
MKNDLRNFSILLLIFVFASILSSCNKPSDDNPANGRTKAVFKSGIVYGTLTDQEGNIYKTVKIGTQTWMAENLRTTKYRNGDAIANVKPEDKWPYITEGAYCNYKNTLDLDTIATYGRLYNWFAATDDRNLAPDGWHVSTDEDWNVLNTFLGTDLAGGKLKEEGTKHWVDKNLGATNETGFTALPGGMRHLQSPVNSFTTMGYYGQWWSIDKINPSNIYGRNIASLFIDVIRNTRYKTEGQSVRCVKD